MNEPTHEPGVYAAAPCSARIVPGTRAKLDFPNIPKDIPNESRRDQVKRHFPEFASHFMETVTVEYDAGGLIGARSDYGHRLLLDRGWITIRPQNSGEQPPAA